MLAIIPARGGSKGIKNKNIINLKSKPLINYTIEAALKSKMIDNVILSTDSEQIAEVAKKAGCEVPFMRPKELASDTANAIDTYLYTVEKFNSEYDKQISDFIILQPTSPLRTSEDIDNCISLYREKNADSLISVVEYEHPISWAVKINEGVIEKYFEADSSKINRQKIETLYRPNGAIYIHKYKLLKQHYSYYFKNTFAYIMPKERSIDIDDYFDLKFAEFILNEK